MTDPAAHSESDGRVAGKAATPSRRDGRPATADRDQKARQRLEREAGVRRAVFVASVAGFIAVLGLVAVAGKPGAEPGVAEAPAWHDAAAPRRVLAETSITNVLDPGGPETIIRIVEPESAPTQARLRTRAT
jgi:hypothetical protein